MWNHPFVDWIWAGGLLMAFGGAVSLADRGLRVAKVERRVVRPAAAGSPLPEAPPILERGGRLGDRRGGGVVKRLIYLVPVLPS